MEPYYEIKGRTRGKQMYKKSLIKKLLGIALCTCLLAGEVIPAAAMGKTVTSEVPAETSVEIKNSQGSRKYPVGGMKKAEDYELTQKPEDVETFQEELEDENNSLSIEAREALNSGLSSNYGYSLLTSKEKTVYNLIKEKAFLFHVSTNNASTINVSSGGRYYGASAIDVRAYGVTFNQMEKIYFAIEADYPELFWLDDTLLYKKGVVFVQEWYIVVEPDYATYSARKSAMENIKQGMLPYLQEIDNAKASGASEMELELLIHDMIINEVDYAYDWFGNPETATFAHSIVGVFDGNSTTDVVCEGYSKSFHLLCNYAGLESIYGVGWSGNDWNGGGHAWNLIKINGKWYNIDLTWDDVDDLGYEGYSYDFFNLTTAEFNEDNAHDYRPDYFGGMYDVPEGVDTAANYYNYFGLNVTSKNVATEAAFKNLIKGAIAGNEERRDNLLRFNCDSNDTLKKLDEKLMDTALKKAILSEMKENGVEYSITEQIEYSNYRQMLVSVSKAYVENVCDGYVFGNPENTTVVYNWKNRKKEDITGKYTMKFDKSGSTGEKLTISNKTSGEVLGTYTYNKVIPVISNIASQEYNGSGICPDISISVNGVKLQNKKDYVTEYSNNVNAGTGKILVKGIGSYAGTIEKTFSISPKDIGKLTITLSSSKLEYDGKAKKPQVIVKDSERVLVSGSDYSIAYKNNVATGAASAVITGKGNYKNSKQVSFIIVPGQSSGVKLSSGTGKSLKFSWKKQSGVSGYEISLYKGSKKVKVATTGKTSYKFTKLNENTQYTFKVRAYKKIDGTKHCGKYSSKLTVKTATKVPAGFSVIAGNKSAALKWKKSSGASGYEVYMSTKQKSGYTKVATIKKGSTLKYTKKKLSKNKTYYFKIRSYTTKNNFKSYSGYTSVKKVKIK